jgi:site-specific DNA recombinase
MKGAVGYFRVSTAEQANTNHSLPSQQRKFEHFCQHSGLPVVESFIDRGESARTADRPEFRRMLAYCKEHRHKISHLVVSDLSRLARNVLDQGNTVVALAQMDIKLVSCDEPNLDESAAGKLLKNVLGSMHQFFSDSLSEKTKARMRAAVEAGRFPWPAPIGYLNRNKQLITDPDNAPLVQKAFQLIASGRYATQDEVLQAVNTLGLRTHRGQPVKKQTFSRMLQNLIYLGWIVTDDVKVRGLHEPLITQEVFDAVQNRINSKSVPHTALRDDFPLRGFVKCASCGKALTSGWSKGRNKSYPRYWCWESSCTKPVGIGKETIGFASHLLRMVDRLSSPAI